MARQRAYPQGVAGYGNAAQFGKLTDIDDPLRRDQAQVHRRHQALAAGQEFRLVAVGDQHLQGVGHAGGAGVAESRGLHACDLPAALPGDVGSLGDPTSPGSAVNSCAGACPCRRTGSHFAGTCSSVKRTLAGLNGGTVQTSSLFIDRLFRDPYHPQIARRRFVAAATGRAAMRSRKTSPACSASALRMEANSAAAGDIARRDGSISTNSE